MPDTIDDAQEHPITFNEWSIQRILASEKTQTRRVIDFSKFDPLGQMDMSPGKFEFEGLKNGRSANFREPNGAAVVHCPYGQPGSRLWVREGFRLAKRLNETSPKEAASKDGMVEPPAPQVRYEADGRIITEADEWGRKRPSIHMPRELCRLRLRVEDVRVERVKQISREDALAEGVDPPPELTPKWAFGEKWNDIHGDDAWGRNDWVWVIEFARDDE